MVLGGDAEQRMVRRSVDGRRNSQRRRRSRTGTQLITYRADHKEQGMARTKSAKNTPSKTLEQTLWDAADKMRGNLEAGEYKHVVLGLVFLKYVSDAFAERRAWLEAATADPDNADYYVPKPDRRASIIEDRNEYTSDNVFWVPTESRWGYLQDRAKQPEIGVLIDTAMDRIEAENPALKGVLPKQFARAEIDKRLLGELVDLIGTIGFTKVDHGADDVLGRVYEYFLGQLPHRKANAPASTTPPAPSSGSSSRCSSPTTAGSTTPAAAPAACSSNPPSSSQHTAANATTSASTAKSSPPPPGGSPR